MKKIISVFLALFILSLSYNAGAQTSKPYTDGALWQVSFIQIKPGMDNLYVKNLADNWVKTMKQAKMDGIIMDYKILSADAATRNDWNMMLMYEVRNFASLDGLGEKMEAIRNKLMGSEESQMKGVISRSEMREIFGQKLLQEMNFK